MLIDFCLRVSYFSYTLQNCFNFQESVDFIVSQCLVHLFYWFCSPKYGHFIAIKHLFLSFVFKK